MNSPHISIFSAGGTLLGQFGLGTYSSNPEPTTITQVDNPTDIFLDSTAQEVYVVDDNGLYGRVDVFDMNGLFKRQIGNGILNAPFGAALDGLGYLYVADSANNRVVKFTTSGQMKLQFGSAGSGPGQLAAPTGVALGPDGNVYVGETDFGAYHNQRISVFSSTGRFVRSFGGPGTGNDQFGTNIGNMQFDASGLLWVSDMANYRIQVLDRYGTFSQSFGSGSGTSLGQFGSNVGITPAQAFDGGFYVTDQGNSRVQRYYNCGSTPTPTFTPTPTPAPTPFSRGLNLRLDGNTSSNYTDHSAGLWLADQAYSSGGFGYISGEGGTQSTSSVPVSGTSDPTLYQTYRKGTPLGFEFTLPTGSYQVTLKFADFISTASAQNVMNVTSQGLTVIKGLDVYGAVGTAYALDRTFRVDAVSGTPMAVTLTGTTGQAFLSAIEVTALQQGNGMQIFLSEPGGGALTP